MSGNLEPGRHACSAQVDAVTAHRDAFPNQEVPMSVTHQMMYELNFWRENHVSSARERCFCRQKLRNHRTQNLGCGVVKSGAQPCGPESVYFDRPAIGQQCRHLVLSMCNFCRDQSAACLHLFHEVRLLIAT